MSFIAKLERAREILAAQGRLSTRALERELAIAGEELEELIEELVDVQQVARREGRILVWAGASVTPPSDVTTRASAPTHRVADQVETRKVISILFADLMGSTALQERLDPESVNRVMDAYYEAVRGPVEAAGGTVVQLLGDGVLCAFGIPRIAQDDALRAVRAAMGIQQAFRVFLRAQQWLNVPIGLRVAVNTGEVVVSDEHPAGIGDPLNVAARLQQEARDGEVLIGQVTRRLVANAVTLESAGAFALKGRAETVTAYRVVSLERPTGVTTAAFVGRDDELARISAVCEAAHATPAARLAVVVGSPGLGKSRLIEEVARRLGDTASVVTAQCDAAGGPTFAPVAEALRKWLSNRSDGSDPTDPSDLQSAIAAALPADAPDRDRITTGITALLAGSPASPEETFFVIRRFLTALAQTKPVVLVIDDLHWAEPLLLDLVEHLIQWGGGVPLFVLVGARPELRELRSSLVTPAGFVSDVVTLSGLDAGAAMRLAANVIGANDLPAAVAAKVLATSEGNPLFVGELVRMLVDEGAIERQGERWVVGANLAALEMPPTIHALLAARIERLPPDDRVVLERAAVVGRHFSRGAVAALLSHNGSELDARLEALRRTELIERDTGWFLGEPVLRFHHVLIRDAAYRRLLKGTRAELHAKLADWILAQVGDADDHDETIGWHLEQAHQHLRELGPMDANGRTLGERAARHLSAAGRRALACDDLRVAANLLGRAIDRLDSADHARADLALDWCEALLAAGDVGPAANAIAELGRFAGANDRTDRSDPSDRSEARLRAWHTCFASQLTVLTAPQGLQAAADAVAEAARQLAAQGDAAGEAKAHSVHAQALARLGKVGAAEAALDQALAAARKAGDRRRANAVLAGAPLAALWGPSPVTRASGRCLDVVRVLRITQGAPAVESVALSCQGVLEALRGRTEAARRMLASARKMVEELGIANRLFEADAFAGRIAMMEGDTATSERLLRGAYEGLRDLGLGIDAARAGTLLARTLLAQGRVAEAEALSYESEQLAGDDLQAAIAWRGVRAEALAKRGEHAAAIELAKAAVAIASNTDALLDHADARVALAAALRAAGRGAEADAEERRAIELWEVKGGTLLVERARTKLVRGIDRASVGALENLALEQAVIGAEPQRPVRRRVRVNAAAENAARIAATLAATDLEAAERLIADSVQIVNHPNGSTYGRPALVDSLRQAMQETKGLGVRHEALATLGELLTLSRQLISFDSVEDERMSVGAAELEYLLLEEVDAVGRMNRAEIFAADRLGDAIACLYGRYAECLQDGPARARAASTARAVAAMLTRSTEDRLEDVMVPDLQVVDHRTVGLGPVRGPDLVSRWRAASDELAQDETFRIDDVLGLRPDALLRRTTQSGTVRASGGAFETSSWALSVFGPDGRQTRFELFDVGHEAGALARFDEITDASGCAPNRRRVRPNAATRGIERLQSVIAARDGAALADVFGESLHTVHHTTRATYGRREMLSTWRSMMKADRMEFRSEILASLGGALALERHFLSIEGLKESHVAAFGRSEFDEVVLIEADDRGRWVRCEIFVADRLGDALARLYGRYGELLPAGPERERAAATARFFAVLVGPPDVDAWMATCSPSIEMLDQRAMGVGSLRGSDATREYYRAMFELESFTLRFDDILDAQPDASLIRTTTIGTARTGGGAYERPVLHLHVFDSDGRLARHEVFDPEREAEALARFDALVVNKAAPPESPFANAASRLVERLIRSWARRDWDGLLAELSPAIRMDDRRRMIRLEIGYADFVAQFRMLFDQPASRWHATLLATRGERLSIHRTSFAAEVAGGGGALAVDDHLSLTEVDRDGRWTASVTFDLDDADAAYVELDARYYAGEGAAPPAHGAIMRAFTRAVVSRDWDPVLALCAPEFVEHDHRSIAVLGTTRGAAAWAQNFSTLVDLAPDTVYRGDHFRSAARGFCSVGTWVGSRDGGRYEIPLVAILELDDRERLARADIYDPDQIDQAFARFDELKVATPPARFSNAATILNQRIVRAWEARDWEAVSAVHSSTVHMDDRRRLMRMRLGADDSMTQLRFYFDVPGSRFVVTPIATRGERLALSRMLFDGNVDGDGGILAIDYLALDEVDAEGRSSALVLFDLDDLDAAYAELDARYEAGEGAAHPAAVVWRDFGAALERRDWDAVAAVYSPSTVAHDHRLVSWGTLEGREAFLQSMRQMVELAPDARMRTDHARTSSRGMLAASMWTGTREGGAFESPFIVVVEVDAHGRAVRNDFYDPHHLDRAWARFEEIGVSAASSPSAGDRER